MQDFTITRSFSPVGSVCVITARYHGDRDPVSAMDEAIPAMLAGVEYEVMVTEPHDPAARVLLVSGDPGPPAGPGADAAAKRNTIQMVLTTPLSVVTSSDLMVSDEELGKIIQLSKNFHQDGMPFEVWTDAGYVVVPPDVTRASILTINIKTEDNEIQEI